MSRYVQIKNNEIVGIYYEIPNVLGQEVSGFDKMTDIERESFGFFAVQQPEEINYNPERQRVKRDEVVLVDGKPVREVEIETFINEEEYNQILLERFWKNVRDYRNEYLRQTDWTMSYDLIEVNGEDWYSKYKNYRQYLRDITKNLQVTDNFVFDLSLIKRPEEV